MSERIDWIIGICNSESDGIRLFRYFGSKLEAREKLFSLVSEDRASNSSGWQYGCDSVEEIEALDNGTGNELYGYGVYYGYNVEYTAKAFAHLEWMA